MLALCRARWVSRLRQSAGEETRPATEGVCTKGRIPQHDDAETGASKGSEATLGAHGRCIDTDGSAGWRFALLGNDCEVDTEYAAWLAVLMDAVVMD